MRVTSYSNLRKNLSTMMDQVHDDHTPVIITRDGGKSAAVLMSLEDFASYQETSYIYWQNQDKRFLKKLNTLIQECARTPFEGSGKLELLKNELSGWWSRRITDEHRLVYRIKDNSLEIAQCRYHY
jgi:toxin YoeB